MNQTLEIFWANPIRILSVKYQLIYTLGRQEDVPELRWKIPEIILELGKSHYETIFKTFNENYFEYIINDRDKISFPHIRFLSRDPYETLCEKILDDIL